MRRRRRWITQSKAPLIYVCIPMLLSEIAIKLNAQLLGIGQIEVTSVNTIRDASESEICFLTSPRHADGLAQSRAAAVLLSCPLDNCPTAQLVVKDVNAALIELQTLFAPPLTAAEGIHPTACIEASAKLDPSATVGPGAYISHGVVIGKETSIGPNSSVGENTRIGDHCQLDSNVAVYHNCRIGNNCVIQANSTIGSTGYGYSFIEGQHRLVPHNGGVILEDGVEVGANSCVDRAKFGNTVIGSGTKIDNQVHIAHNVSIGKCCLLAGQVGISGSVRIGDGVVFGGQSGAADNFSVGDGAIIGARSSVVSDVEPGAKGLGFGPLEMRQELRCISVYNRLPELAKQVKQLNKKIENLDAAKDN